MSKKPKHEDEFETMSSAPDDDEPMFGTQAAVASSEPVIPPKDRLQAIADDLNYQSFHNGPVPPHMVRELYDIVAALGAAPKE